MTNDQLNVVNDALSVMKRSITKALEYVQSNNNIFEELAQKMFKTKEQNGVVHITGVGRSLIVGKVFAELLVDLGFNISIIGSNYAKPVEDHDVVLGVSGSGFTKTTISNIEACTQKNVYIIGVTTNPQSIFGRIVDLVIDLDWCERTKEATTYEKKQIDGKSAPLTPMGTLFELTALIILIGFIYSLDKKQSKNEQHIEYLNKVKQTLNYISSSLQKKERLHETFNTLIEAVKNNISNNNQTFLFGAEMGEKIAIMSGIRLQHLGVNTIPTNLWRLRTKEDLVIFVYTQLEHNWREYKNNEEMPNRFIITSTNSNEKTIKDKDEPTIVTIPICSLKKPYVAESHKYKRHTDEFVFYSTSACILDGIVAQIAHDMSISEDKMKRKHANIQ